jgi:glycosyltransferase involved in cell wall biosynthesis
LFLGNLIPRKGLHILVDALSKLAWGTWHLSVAGGLSVDPTYAAQVMQQINSYELAEQIHILGPLNEEQVAAQLKRSHLLVLPSLYEGFGIAYLEGMGYGLPAIATTAGAAHEIISHGENGYLVPPGDANSLASCLQEMLSDRQRLVEMSLKARQRYAAHPTWEQTTGHIRAFLHGLVNDI